MPLSVVIDHSIWMKCWDLHYIKWETFPFNLSCNIVALQVEKHCCPYYHYMLNFPCNKFQYCKLKKFIAKSRTWVFFANILLQCATLEFVMWWAWVQHALVIRSTTHSTCNATMLHHTKCKLNENVAHIIYLGQTTKIKPKSCFWYLSTPTAFKI